VTGRAYAAGVESGSARRVSATILGYGPGMPRGQAGHGAAAGPETRPELADIGRLAGRLMRRAVAVARAEDGSVRAAHRAPLARRHQMLGQQ
jgi:hypothetical protein